MNNSNENLKQQEVRDDLNLPCTFQLRRPGITQQPASAVTVKLSSQNRISAMAGAALPPARRGLPPHDHPRPVTIHARGCGRMAAGGAKYLLTH
eukprot:scaffold8542_cov76-Skeletonema_dohrnii-CCMP3373.AAC.1